VDERREGVIRARGVGVGADPILADETGKDGTPGPLKTGVLSRRREVPLRGLLMKCHSVAILAAAIYLAGCGVSNTSSSSTPSPTPPSNHTPVNANITGNWQLTATSSETAYAGEYGNYGVYLTQTGSTVSGISWPQGAFPMCILPSGLPCAFPYGVINPYLSGAIDADGNIVLNSPSYDGAAFSITGDTTNGSTLNSIYTITLVTTSPPGTFVDHGTISGYMMGILNGTYTGTVKSSVTGNSMGVTTNLSQATSPDSSGYLEVNGSANFTGSACFNSATMPTPGGLLGNMLVVGFVPTSSPTTNITLSGTLSQDTKTIVVSYLVNGGCGDDNGGGTLTLQ
jgi:hypothetical protein